jgi:hypothetical protein
MAVEGFVPAVKQPEYLAPLMCDCRSFRYRHEIAAHKKLTMTGGLLSSANQTNYAGSVHRPYQIENGQDTRAGANSRSQAELYRAVRGVGARKGYELADQLPQKCPKERQEIRTAECSRGCAGVEGVVTNARHWKRLLMLMKESGATALAIQCMKNDLIRQTEKVRACKRGN